MQITQAHMQSIRTTCDESRTICTATIGPTNNVEFVEFTIGNKKKWVVYSYYWQHLNPGREVCREMFDEFAEAKAFYLSHLTDSVQESV